MKKLHLGQLIHLKKIEKYDQSMTIEMDGSTEILSAMVCEKLLMKV
jgi:hypothetical protein